MLCDQLNEERGLRIFVFNVLPYLAAFTAFMEALEW